MPSVSPSGGGGGTTMTGWTTDANGNTVFAPTAPLHNRWLVIQAPVGSKANETDALALVDEDGNGVLLIACEGGFQTAETASSTDGIRHKLSSNGSNSGFRIQTSGGATSFRVAVDGTIGFFASVPAAQQTIHSGSATPESLALALEASTLMTGD